MALRAFKKSESEVRVPIGDELFLPNNSGTKNHPEIRPILVPIGSVVAWLKSLTGVPQLLPEGFVECDGSVINNVGSPLNGTTIPDLNSVNQFFEG